MNKIVIILALAALGVAAAADYPVALYAGELNQDVTCPGRVSAQVFPDTVALEDLNLNLPELSIRDVANAAAQADMNKASAKLAAEDYVLVVSCGDESNTEPLTQTFYYFNPEFVKGFYIGNTPLHQPAHEARPDTWAQQIAPVEVIPR